MKSMVTKEELHHRIEELASESSIKVPKETIQKAVRLIEYLIQMGFNFPLKVDPTLEEGLRIRMEGSSTLAEFTVSTKGKDTLTISVSNSKEPILEMEGEIKV